MPSVAPHTSGVAELGSHSLRAAVGERLGAPAFLFEVFSGGASPSPTVRKERANHGAKRSYPSAKHIFLYIFLNLCYNTLNK